VRVFDCLVRVLCDAVRLTIRNRDTGQRRRQECCVAIHGASCATKPCRVRGRSAGHPVGLPCAHVGQLGTGAPARSTSPAPHPALCPCRALACVRTSLLPCAGGGDAAQSGTARASSVIASLPPLTPCLPSRRNSPVSAGTLTALGMRTSSRSAPHGALSGAWRAAGHCACLRPVGNFRDLLPSPAPPGTRPRTRLTPFPCLRQPEHAPPALRQGGAWSAMQGSVGTCRLRVLFGARVLSPAACALTSLPATATSSRWSASHGRWRRR